MTDFADSLRLTKTIANAKYWQNQIKRLQIIKWLVGLLVHSQKYVTSQKFRFSITEYTKHRAEKGIGIPPLPFGSS